MVVMSPYAIDALQWGTLGSCISKPNSQHTPSITGSIQTSIDEILQTKPWLLEKNQNLQLPPTHLDDCGGRVYSLNAFVQHIDQSAANDLEACAREHLALSSQQLEEIRIHGYLTVPSVNFKDQYHRWQVAPGFYSGSETVRASWKEGFGRTLDHAVCYSTDAVVDHAQVPRWLEAPSIRRAVEEGGYGAVNTVQQATTQSVGTYTFPKYSASSIEMLLEQARNSYVTHCLQQEVEDPSQVRRLFGNSMASMQEFNVTWDELAETGLVDDIRPSTETFGQLQCDRKELQRLRQAFENTASTKRDVSFDHRARRSAKAVLDAKKIEDERWSVKKNQLWIEYLETTTSAKDIARLEAARLQALEAERDVQKEDDALVLQKLEKFKTELRRRRPILSLSKVWRSRKIDEQRESLIQTMDGSRISRVAEKLEEVGLPLHARARKLAVEFDTKLGKTINNTLASTRTTFQPARFMILQLNPNNWRGDPNRGFNKYKTFEVALDKPLWRLRYLALMWTKLTKGMIGGSYHFLTAGPLSLRALFCRQPYYAVERPVRDPNSLTSTWQSRLNSFYKSLREYREHFEMEPDTGLIGKPIQRFFLHLNHTIQTIIGTMAISGFMVVGTLLVSTMCTGILVGAPVLAGAATTVVALSNAILYDAAIAAARCRGPKSCEFVGCAEDNLPTAISPLVKLAVVAPYNLLAPGVLQGVLATLRCTVFHPVVGTIQLVWASSRFSARCVRDAITWRILRRHVRVPSSDSFLAWRIHGPGLSSKIYYRLPLEAAKASVVLALDRLRLAAHSQIRRTELDEPYHAYLSLFSDMVKPFTLGVSMKVQRPSSVALELCQNSRNERLAPKRDLEDFSRPSFNQHRFDIWDGIALDIRSADPNYKAVQADYQYTRWIRRPTSLATPLDKLDKLMAGDVDSALKDYNRHSTPPLPDWIRRPARLLAVWNLRSHLRDQRLVDAVSIPPNVRGRFRMNTEDCDELWKFTLEAVEEFAKSLRDELNDVASQSAFSKSLESTAMQAMQSFYVRAGASPGQDALVAALLLKTLLGGEDALETLQESDEEFVLQPTLSPVDMHLTFAPWLALK